MRPLALATLVIAACTAPPPALLPTPTPSPEPGVLAVTALLDLSGPQSAVGVAQRDAMRLWLDRRRETGARPEVRLNVVDLAGSEARVFIELRRAVEARSDAVIIGVPVFYGDVLGRAIELARVPVLFTLPLDVVDPVTQPGGNWAFALAPPLARLAAAAIADATIRGVLAPSLVLARDGPEPDPHASALEAEMTRRGRDPITRIALPTDSVPPVVRSSLSVLRSAHCTAAIGACAAVARDATALAAPTFFYLSYLATPGEVSGQSELAGRAIWPASRWINPAEGGSPERRRFLSDHLERFGPASSHAAAAYDALTLLALAAANGATEVPELARAALERINMPLIATTYAFGADRHSGARPEDLAFVQWRAGSVTYALPAIFGTGIQTPSPSPSPIPSPSPSP